MALRMLVDSIFSTLKSLLHGGYVAAVLAMLFGSSSILEVNLTIQNSSSV